MSHLHVVWPENVDDPRRPSGGNVYDRELQAALEEGGVTVHEHHDLRGVPDGSDVLLDGLLGLADPESIVRELGRLRVLLLVHLPLTLAHPGDPVVAEREARALAAADGVVTTSHWTRRWLLARYPLGQARVTVAGPGTTPAPPAASEPQGRRLLCVGPLTPAKGQDVLVDALARLRRPSWSCLLVGAADLDPGFTEQLQDRIARAGIGDRVRLGGPVTREAMSATYDATDLLVVPSRLESYGMVITEALARGIPVVAADTGGVSEALVDGPLGRPGVLVPADDAAALQVALTRWLADDGHRGRLRTAARVRADGLPRWSQTAGSVLAAVNQLLPHAVVRA
jgi:glycosyltransferase involved in cell wall biosynthesis